VSLALASVAPWALAQESVPAWSQYQGGPGHAGALQDGPQPPFRERWRLPAPAGESLSGAIVLGDLVVTVGSEGVYGADVATGEVSWDIPRAGGPLSVPAAAEVDGSTVVLFLEGPREDAEPGPDASKSPSGTPSGPPSGSPSAAPSPSGGAASAEAEAVSTLVAVSLTDRTELWRVPLKAEARSGVTVDGTTAYVGDEDGNVVALSVRDGSQIWSVKVPGRVDAAVAAADGKVYAVARDADAGQATIVALAAATGEQAWTVVPQATSTVGSAPAAGTEAVLVGSADRRVRSIAAEDGAVAWSALVLSFFSPATAPAFAGGYVYAADLSGGLYRLDAADGDRRWSYQSNEVVFRSAPVVSGPTVLLGLNDGRLIAVNADSGHLVWQSEPSPGLIGTLALGDDVVIAVKGGRDAGLIAFEHDPDGALVDVPSPTEFDAGTTVSRYAVAAAIVMVGTLVPGILLRRRFGPANLSGGDGGPADEDFDASEDSDQGSEEA